MLSASAKLFHRLALTALCIRSVSGIGVIYDGRAPPTLTQLNLDASAGPYLTGVKGFQNASHYTTLLGPYYIAPTPLWNQQLLPLLSASIPSEQAISIKIDNSSVFIPGGGAPQYGFRRTELIAQQNDSSSLANIDADMETGVTVFHFSIRMDESAPLNYDHEYQIVFIEPSDGTHVFGIQLGSPFTNPTGRLPAPKAHWFKVLDHALNILFETPFTPKSWHNFAIQVDWGQRTLAVFYSKDDKLLVPVTEEPLPNTTVGTGSDGQGDFHFGVLKVDPTASKLSALLMPLLQLPLVNPADTPTNQGDVVHYGLQEGTIEGLLYSGVFVESAVGGVSVGGKATLPLIA